MIGRKKYKWRGLTEDQETLMGIMLNNAEPSPAKDISCSSELNSSHTLVELSNIISPELNLKNVNANNSLSDLGTKYSPQGGNISHISDKTKIGENLEVDNHTVVTKHNQSPQDVWYSPKSCSDLKPDPAGLIVSPFDENISLLAPICFESDPTLSGVKNTALKERKDSKQKTKRRSSAFNSIVDMQNSNEKLMIDTVHSKIKTPGESIKNEISSPLTENGRNQNVNYSPSTSNARNISITSLDAKSLNLQCDFNSSYINEDKTTNNIPSRRSGSNSFLQHMASFLDDSDILRQVKEADFLLGGMENSISDEKLPILDNRTIKKVSKNGMKLRSVRRSSRLFRNQQTKLDGTFDKTHVTDEPNEKENTSDCVQGSIFTQVEIKAKARGGRRFKLASSNPLTCKTNLS